jgi:glycine/D-amino acid oxidase-like deaminating enzyme
MMMMKELHTGNLYWPGTFNETRQFAPLADNCKTQVLVVGGGMSGTICSYELVGSGMSVMMVERGQVAGGSTSANTGLLQFSNDMMLSELSGQIGDKAATTFYKACRDAVRMLGDAAAALPADVDFKTRSSLYYASSEQDLPKLRAEYEALRACGLDVEFWSPEMIGKHFPFRKSGAIVTHGDAEVNPFRFVNTMANAAADAGLRIHEQTDIVAHDRLPGGSHRLRTADGFEIEAEHVVYAIGYEPEELRGQLIKAELNRSYAIVTEPQPSLADWHQRFLLWETARPYLYLRTTPDNRIIVGGLDEEIAEPLHSEQGRHKRGRKLLEQLKALFPDFAGSAAYEWSATFGESRDGLPFIGEDPNWPNVYYCLGYGGNGTVYSMIASQVLRDLIKGDIHPLADIIKLDRPSLTRV